MSRILLVEDTRMYCTLITAKLRERLACEITTVETFAAARDLLAAGGGRDIDVAILDLVLPDAPGGEIIDLVAQYKLPIVVFAATFTQGFRETMLEKNVFDYFLKLHGTAMDPVVEAVERILKNNQVKILVVDDSATMRNMLRTMLEAYRFQVLTVEDGAEALKLLETHPGIQLVITDYDMPRVDGFELITRIRAQSDRYELPIIGISAQVNPIDSVKFLKNGANDFLTKPFLKEELYNRVLMNLEMAERLLREKETAQKMAALNELKNRFLGMAAHDLRNPLGGISGLAALLAEDAPEMTALHRKYVEAIHEASTMMLDLVNDLLDISVIESGRLELHPELAELGDLVAARVLFYQPIAEKKRIQVIHQPVPAPKTRFDMARIAQVIDNLLTNAIKFSPPDTTVVVTCKAQGNEVVVAVRDQGPGLSAKDQERLFGAFQKLSARPTGGETSTGLGLSIARKVIDAHGGRIWAESQPGAGARFCFSLPVPPTGK